MGKLGNPRIAEPGSRFSLAGLAQCPPGFDTSRGLRKGENRGLANEKAAALGELLLAQAELGDDILIALGIVDFQVVEQATPFADQHKESAA
jgi:hypothetical protein